MTDKLRVGMIGMGLIAALGHVPRLRATGRAEIVAACRRNPAKLAMASEALGIPQTYTDWREMLERAPLDAVVVAAPIGRHAEPTIAALQRGLHVLVEKPLALASRDAHAMADAAGRSGRVLMAAYEPRFGGTWRTVKRLVSDGALGRLRQISLTLQTYRRWKWKPELTPPDHEATMRKLAEDGGVPVSLFDEWGQASHSDRGQVGAGTFVDTAVHQLDLVLWIAQAPPVVVAAFTEAAGMPVECFVNAQARLANGVLLSVTSADAVPGGIFSGSQQIMIVGDDALILRDRDGSLWLKCPGGTEKIEATVAGSDPDADFVSAVLDGAENTCPPDEAAWSVALVEAVYRSAQEGRIVQTGYPMAATDG